MGIAWSDNLNMDAFIKILNIDVKFGNYCNVLTLYLVMSSKRNDLCLFRAVKAVAGEELDRGSRCGSFSLVKKKLHWSDRRNFQCLEQKS